MSKHVLIIQGHSDSTNHHFCHAIASAYKNGARNSNYSVKVINIAELDFPILHTKDEFENDMPTPDIQTSQREIHKLSSIQVTKLLMVYGLSHAHYEKPSIFN